MIDSNEIVRQRQSAIRRELDRRSIPLKVVSADAGIPYPTLLTYFPQEGGARPVMLPMSAVYSLIEGRAIPDDLLQLLLPSGAALVRIPEDIDIDDFCEVAGDILRGKDRAHHPDSEAGREIGPGEKAELTGKIVALRAMAA